jgi:hypothetical protein
MVETEKLLEVQRAWPISPFKRYSGVRRRLSQQPCTSRMVVTLVLCLLACAQASAAGEWQSADGYRFKTLTVSTNEPVGFTSLSPGSTGIDFVNRLGKERYTPNQIYLNGAGVAAGDYDGDGMFDLFFCGLDSENKLYRNLGQGTWMLLNDGQGGFRGLSSTESGVTNLGQARGSVVSDFNGDGRVDLLTAQNNDRVKLHLNLNGKPGLRVRLKGAGETVQAIGSSIRLEQNGALGFKREIRLGSGYWSQDSLVQLFVIRDLKAKLHIRWADSSIATVPVPAGAKPITISQADGVKVDH